MVSFNFSLLNLPFLNGAKLLQNGALGARAVAEGFFSGAGELQGVVVSGGSRKYPMSTALLKRRVLVLKSRNVAVDIIFYHYVFCGSMILN